MEYKVNWIIMHMTNGSTITLDNLNGGGKTVPGMVSVKKGEIIEILVTDNGITETIAYTFVKNPRFQIGTLEKPEIKCNVYPKYEVSNIIIPVISILMGIKANSVKFDNGLQFSVGGNIKEIIVTDKEVIVSREGDQYLPTPQRKKHTIYANLLYSLFCSVLKKAV
ncbi:MAG: hypothetical protein HY802_03520 [Methanobacterium sp.]|nr:hypothetical protein [Methanobacterium sp.]